MLEKLNSSFLKLLNFYTIKNVRSELPKLEPFNQTETKKTAIH